MSGGKSKKRWIVDTNDKDKPIKKFTVMVVPDMESPGKAMVRVPKVWIDSIPKKDDDQPAILGMGIRLLSAYRGWPVKGFPYDPDAYYLVMSDDEAFSLLENIKKQEHIITCWEKKNED
jgi:hypothetical protein